MSRGELQARVRSGVWRVVWPGVLCDAGSTLDDERRAFAAVLASGGPARAVAAGRTAARLWSLPLLDDQDPATGAHERRFDEVLVRHAPGPLRRASPEGERVLRRLVRHTGRGEVVRHPSGLWVTSPLRTIVDGSTLLSQEALVSLVDAALHRHLVDELGLRSAVEALRWCPGAPALRWAAERADRRAESPAETLARLALRPALQDLVPQHRLVHDGRVLARFDLADERRRFAVEVDGKAGHAGPEMAAKDRLRDRVARQHGWHTERVTWWELRCDREALVRRVTAAAEEHTRRSS